MAAIPVLECTFYLQEDAEACSLRDLCLSPNRLTEFYSSCSRRDYTCCKIARKEQDSWDYVATAQWISTEKMSLVVCLFVCTELLTFLSCFKVLKNQTCSILLESEFPLLFDPPASSGSAESCYCHYHQPNALWWNCCRKPTLFDFPTPLFFLEREILQQPAPCERRDSMRLKQLPCVAAKKTLLCVQIPVERLILSQKWYPFVSFN